MTRIGSIRGFGTACLGTAFLGLGCTQDNDPPSQVDGQPPLAHPRPAAPAILALPRTERLAADKGWIVSERIPSDTAGPTWVPSTNAKLLTSASEIGVASPSIALPPETELSGPENHDEDSGSEAIGSPLDTNAAPAEGRNAPAGGEASEQAPGQLQSEAVWLDLSEETEEEVIADATGSAVENGGHGAITWNFSETTTEDQPLLAAQDAVDAPMGEAIYQPAEAAVKTASPPASIAVRDVPLAAEVNELPEEKVLAARRSIPARQQSVAQIGTGWELPLSPRTSIMASVNVPRPSSEPVVVANDTEPATEQLPPVAVPNFASVLPRREPGDSLGLEKILQDLKTADAAFSVQEGAAVEVGVGSPEFSYQDELILELKVEGYDATDTIVAYDSPEGIYLPLGALGRILDLALRISDDGNYAYGWVLREERVVRIDLRQGVYEIGGQEAPLPEGYAVAFEGEMFLRGEDIARFVPIEIETSLRSQSVTIKTLEPFPFEERLEREADRKRLANGGKREVEKWPRSETPWRLATVPGADVQLRAVSRSTDGEQLEGDLTIAGDLAFLSAQAFFSSNSQDGLVSSLVEVGRIDPDGELLGPLRATEFAVGDVSNPTMPLGLRSVSGRGFSVSNAPLGAVSAFDKIDLRGVLQDGYEVELYRNDILVGSTTDRVNGRYEFLQVPVDFGLNIFRLVFYGPQGQRYEEVRTISVGDGRLSKGELVYRIGAVQKDQNVLGVRDPDRILPPDFGDWRATAEIGFGLTTDITTVMGAAWYQDGGLDQWIATGGVRTSLGRFAVKADVAAASGNAFAFSGGIAGRLGHSAFTVTHIEYTGGFLDETRTTTREFLQRSTELNFNTSLSFGKLGDGVSIPITARLRHFETLDGRQQTSALLRGSARLPGLLVSNTFEFSRTSQPGSPSFSQLVGNFDLATLGRSKTRGRASLGYAILPNPELLSAALEVDHALDEKTSLRASAGYVFASNSPQVSASARRDFDRFSLSLDGNYTFDSKAYAVGLRLALSFGRDPLTGRFFTSRDSLASSGSASLLAFHDRDADGVYGPRDVVLPDVDLIAFNSTSRTDQSGVARLIGLGNGRPVSLQVDTTSLPDIDLAPASPGFEIVPRAGRIYGAKIPIVSLSEVEGTVALIRDGTKRAVSGVRLELRRADGTAVAFAKTEVDGYFFFERVPPGSYAIAIDQGQASRLGICLDKDYPVSVGGVSSAQAFDIAVVTCS